MDMSFADLQNITYKKKSKQHAIPPANPPAFPCASAGPVISHSKINFEAASGLVSRDGKVELPVVEFLKLLQIESQVPSEPPQTFFISKASYVGVAKENCIHMKCSFEVAILVNTWVHVKLLPDGVGLSSHAIKPSAKNSNNNNSESSVSSQQARIGVMGDGYYLITSAKAEYLVEMDVLVPYHSPRKTGMMIWVPRAAENVVSFKVSDRDIQIKVDPSFVGEEHNNKENLNETSVLVLFPPTDMLSVNWTVKIDEGPSSTKDEPKLQKMMITAEHNTMCSIGEGVVVLTSNFNYTIVHGSVTTFEVNIPDDLHVLGVEGNGIKKWEVIGGKDKTALIVLDTKPSQRCLRVVLDYGLENSYQMTVISELSMQGTSADVVIPSFKCVGEEINREKGHLAIEARTNVEIAEIKREYLALVDTSELPQTLWQLAGNPILMGYKFLAAGYFLELRVKKHEDVGVLIAACDDAHFITTCSEEGKILHKLIMRIRNSQKQYVRIKIPTEHELWSAAVAGVPVKPAMDEEGMVMIQLHKSSGKNASNPNNVFIVELVYMEIEDRPMRESGSISIALAQLDIPINYLFVSIYLPNDYEYEDFRGGLKEVSYFTRNPPSGAARSNDYATDMYSNVQVWYSEKPSRTSNKNNTQTKGVLPVMVEMPVSGQEFKFEQLIVMSSRSTIQTTYRRTKNKSYGHRRTRHWWNCCC